MCVHVHKCVVIPLRTFVYSVGKKIGNYINFEILRYFFIDCKLVLVTCFQLLRLKTDL